jgi:type IV secretory pathway VirB2 component (pilin)
MKRRAREVLDRYGPPALALAVACVPRIVHAQTVTGGTDPTTILNAIATYILGPFGQVVAVLGLIAVGVAFMFGRVGIFLLGGVIGGLVLIFGSAFLVQQFFGGVGAG